MTYIPSHSNFKVTLNGHYINTGFCTLSTTIIQRPSPSIIILNPLHYRKPDGSFIMHSGMYDSNRFILDLEKLAKSNGYYIPMAQLYDPNDQNNSNDPEKHNYMNEKF